MTKPCKGQTAKGQTAPLPNFRVADAAQIACHNNFKTGSQKRSYKKIVQEAGRV
jgi:hypothetical protein